jgi:hypothetical protein
MITVRHAFISDLSEIVRQATLFSRTYNKGPFDEAYIPHLVTLLIREHLALLAEMDGAPVGMLLAAKAPCLFDPAVMMWQEIAWWAEPGSRAMGIGTALLTCFEQDVGDAPTLLCTLPTTPVAQSWFKARGWTLQQSTFGRNM